MIPVYRPYLTGKEQEYGHENGACHSRRPRYPHGQSHRLLPSEVEYMLDPGIGNRTFAQQLGEIGNLDRHQ